MAVRRVRRRGGRQRDERTGSLLLVTLAQCALCALIVGAADFASSFFGLTEVRQAVAILLTKEGDAQQAAETVKALLREKPLPSAAAGRLPFSLPAAQMLEGNVTSGYGCREDPFTGERDFHTGIDIAAPLGTPVRAAYAGTVEEVGASRVYGNCVLLRHEGFETRYCHCDEILVSKGERIKAGDVIALVGETGRATGPHLHFELLLDGEAADPTEVITGCA